MTNLTNMDLTTLTSENLKKLAKEFKISNWWNLKKLDLISNLTTIKESQIKESTPKSKKVISPEALGDESEDEEAKETPKVEKDEENLITLKDLASEFNMKGTKARRILRNNSAARPFGGNRWEWDKNLHKTALEVSRKALKESTK